MKRTLTALSLMIGVVVLTGCQTAKGTAVGAGIGAIAGDAKTGAIVGGTIGAMQDIF